MHHNMLSLGVILALYVALTKSYPECPSGLTCGQLTPVDAPDLKFDCAFARSTTSQQRGNVFHMHGDDGLRSKAMFADVMLKLAAEGFNSLACD